MITGLLLAAGRSRRYGTDKRLVALADGRPLLLAAWQNLASEVDQTLVLLDADAEAVAELLVGAGARVEFCPDAAAGMGHTLAFGVGRSAAADGWLVALGDMPFIQRSTIGVLADALRAGAGIAAPEYQGRRGHPVGFGRPFKAELQRLAGDRGARELIDASSGVLQRIAVNDPGVLKDVDRPQDLWV